MVSSEKRSSSSDHLLFAIIDCKSTEKEKEVFLYHTKTRNFQNIEFHTHTTQQAVNYTTREVGNVLILLGQKLKKDYNDNVRYKIFIRNNVISNKKYNNI